ASTTSRARSLRCAARPHRGACQRGSHQAPRAMTCRRCDGPVVARVVRVRRDLVALLVVVGIGLAYWLTGDLLHDTLEGNDRTRLALWTLAVPVVVLLAGAVAATLRLRRPVCDACGAGPSTLLVALPRERSERILALGRTRRVFLRTLGATGAAAAATV